jgi:hypothetical protein
VFRSIEVWAVCGCVIPYTEFRGEWKLISRHVEVRKVLLVLGALISNRWNCCEKIMCARFEVGYLSSMWAFQPKLFFFRYIAEYLIGLDHLVVGFWWVPKF